jgi:hypothetical protein
VNAHPKGYYGMVDAMNCGPFIRTTYLDYKSDTIVIKLRKRAHIERAIAGLHIKSSVVWASVVCPNCEDNCAVARSAIPTRGLSTKHVSVAVSEEGKTTKFTTGYDVLGRRSYKCPKCNKRVQSSVAYEGRANPVIVELIKRRNDVNTFQRNVQRFRKTNEEEITILETRLHHLSQPAYEAWYKHDKPGILQTPVKAPSTINGMGRVGQPGSTNEQPNNTNGPVGQPGEPGNN